jgi:predicted dehydrogenase
VAIWNAAAARRLPTFMEKPFGLSGELERVESLPATRRLLMPDFNHRFWPGFQMLRELCLRGRIGTVERADFTLRVNIGPWNSVTSHRLPPDEGGALYDLGSSQLDLIEYVFREKIVSVHAQTRSIRSAGDQVRRGRTGSSYHVLGDCSLADLDAELEKLAVDPFPVPICREFSQIAQ